MLAADAPTRPMMPSQPHRPGSGCGAIDQARYSTSRLREQPKSAWAQTYVVWSTWRRSVSSKRQQPWERAMDLDLRLQRSLNRVELVGGTIGNPGDGRLCLMSLVAFLAGEDHSDAPGCASPLIQAFAIRINDNMPHAARQ